MKERERSLNYQLSAGGTSLVLLVLLLLGSALVSIFFNIFFQEVSHVNEPLHAGLETFGAIAAISMAFLLLQLHADGRGKNGEFFLLSMGFLMLGILDAGHAVSSLGRGFVLLRSLAGVCGGFWFVLVWLPGAGSYLSKLKFLPWIVACCSISAGIVISLYRENFPMMMVDKSPSPFAIATFIISGVFLIVAAFYFLRQFLRDGKIETYLFACMFFLTGFPALLCIYSEVWTDDWWFWHFQRCGAYAVVFYFMLRTFLRIRSELKQANELLEQRIAARTAELSKEVADRKRYGRERDKVIIELQEALVQIKTLTGLLPICSACKKIKDEESNWIEMESYIQTRSTATFTHGICPDCVKKLYPDFYQDVLKRKHPSAGPSQNRLSNTDLPE